MMIYLGLTLSAILFLWMAQHYQRRQKKTILSAQKLLLCEYCKCAYVGEISKNITQCPLCHSYNKNNHYQREF